MVDLASILSFRCKSCRTRLFDENALALHSRKRRGECRSLFVEEPLAWMTCVGQRGKVACPQCNAKVGAWEWSGIRCSCGDWVAPGFQISLNRVDAKATKRRLRVEAASSVSVQWLRTSPPPCVVLVVGGEEARYDIENRWLGRHVTEGRAAWLYPRADKIEAACREVAARGVPLSRIAVGGIGCCASLAAATSDASIVFALSARAHADLVDALATKADTAFAIFVDSPDRPDLPFTHHVFRRLEPGVRANTS